MPSGTLGDDDGGYKRLLGSHLQYSGSHVATEEYLSTADSLGLFFSSQRFEDCQAALKTLLSWYTRFKTGPLQQSLEICYVSDDQSASAFAQAVALHPWPAIPFAAQHTRKQLLDRFAVYELPALVFIDQSGRVLCRDGLDAIAQDNTNPGQEVPWSSFSRPPAPMLLFNSILSLLLWVVYKILNAVRSLVCDCFQRLKHHTKTALESLAAATRKGLWAVIKFPFQLVWMALCWLFSLCFKKKRSAAPATLEAV